jgi:hypothetical protein
MDDRVDPGDRGRFHGVPGVLRAAIPLPGAGDDGLRARLHALLLAGHGRRLRAGAGTARRPGGPGAELGLAAALYLHLPVSV